MIPTLLAVLIGFIGIVAAMTHAEREEVRARSRTRRLGGTRPVAVQSGVLKEGPRSEHPTFDLYPREEHRSD